MQYLILTIAEGIDPATCALQNSISWPSDHNTETIPAGVSSTWGSDWGSSSVYPTKTTVPSTVSYSSSVESVPTVNSTYVSSSTESTTPLLYTTSETTTPLQYTGTGTKTPVQYTGTPTYTPLQYTAVGTGNSGPTAAGGLAMALAAAGYLL
jgi:hypothetical protein